MNKKSAIKKIVSIQSGHGVDRKKFPESLKGEIAKRNWNEGIFTFGIEYGYILALLEVFEISKEDLL